MQWSTVVQRVDFLAKFNHAVPIFNTRIITRRFAVDLFAESKLDDWATCVWPCRPDDWEVDSEDSESEADDDKDDDTASRGGSVQEYALSTLSAANGSLAQQKQVIEFNNCTQSSEQWNVNSPRFGYLVPSTSEPGDGLRFFDEMVKSIFNDTWFMYIQQVNKDQLLSVAELVLTASSESPVPSKVKAVCDVFGC